MSSFNSGIAHLARIGIDVWMPRVPEDHEFRHHLYSDNSREYTCCAVLKAGNEAAQSDALVLLDNMMRTVGLSRSSRSDDLLVNADSNKNLGGTTSLEDILKCHTPDSLLLSGFKTHQLIADANAQQASKNIIDLGGYSVECWLVESVFTLLRNPVRKHEAWQVLRRFQASFKKK